MTPLEAEPVTPTRRELALVVVVLGLVALVTHLGFLRNGGWISDDWAWVGKGVTADEFGGLYDAFQLGTHRVGAGVTWMLMFVVGGERQAPYLVMALGLQLLQSLLLYALLRLARLRVPLAAGAALLLLLFPAADSAHLWYAATIATVAGVLMLAGMVVAVLAIRRERPLLHLGALVLYALSMLTYETTMGPIALAGLLYAWVGGRTLLARRVAADLAVVGGCLFALLQGGASSRAPGSDDRLAWIWSRLDDFWNPPVFRELLPAEALLWGPVGIALLVLAAVGLARVERPTRNAWLALGAAGVLAGAAGWALLLPAGEYYAPRFNGLANRANATAAIGGSVAYAALAGVVALGLTALVGLRRLATPVAAVAVLAWAAAFAGETRVHQRALEDAYAQAARVAAAIRASVPDLPRDGRVITFAHRTTAAQTGDYPIFANPWELDGALAWIYRDPSTDGRPWLEGAVCAGDGVRHGDGVVFSYAALHFVDVGAYEARRIADRAACEQALTEIPIPVQPYR